MNSRHLLATAVVLVAAAVAPAAEPPGLPDGAVARLGQARLRHAEPPTCVAFAPDGQTFATGAEDGLVRVWSVATGALVRSTPKARAAVQSVSFTPGKGLAVHHAGESVLRLLDPGTLQETGAIPFAGRVRFAFGPGGTLLAAADATGNLVVTEIEDDLPKVELTGADVFAFRPDGKAIAVGDAKGNASIHLLTGGKPTFRLTGLGAVRGLSFSPDGRRLAVGARAASGQESVRVYAGGADKPVAEIAGVHTPREWLSDTRLAVGGGAEAGVYDLAKGEYVGRARAALRAFTVSPDGTKLAGFGGDGLRVRLWELAGGKQLHAQDDNFPDPALMVGTADGKALFLLAADAAYLWPVGAAGAKSAGTLPGVAVAAAGGGRTLAVATSDAVCVYVGFDPLKPLSAKPAHTFEKSARAKAIAVAPHGTRVAWADEAGTVTLADPSGGNRAALPNVTTSVLALAFSPDGGSLAQLGRDGFLRLWRVDGKGAPAERWKARLGRGPRATLAFSPDGKLIAAASLAQVPVFAAADGSEAFRLDRSSDDGQAQYAAFTPDGKRLVLGTGGTAGRVEVWDVAARTQVRTFGTGFGGTSRLCVLPGGRVASAGAEEAVTVWQLPNAAE